MELLKYNKRNTQIIKTSFTQVTEKWFGSKSFLSTERNKEFQDNSLSKETLKKSLILQRINKLKGKLTETSEKASKFRNMRQKLGQHLKNLKICKEKFIDSEKLLKIMNQNAVKIQKIVRGFLIRKVYEKKLIEWTRDCIQLQLKSIEENDKFCLWFVGKQCQESAKVIQRFFRSCLLRKKLKKMHEFYLVVLKAKELERSLKMRPFFVILNAIDKIKEAKIVDKVLKKLKIIRKNLAILKIKYILKRKKIKVKSIRHRIRRFTKKTNMSLPVPNSQNIIANSPSIQEKNSPDKSVYDRNIFEKSPTDKLPAQSELNPSSSQFLINDYQYGDNKERSVDRYSFTSEYFAAQEALKKEKVAKGRIVYKLPSKPPTLFLPIFQDYDPDSRPQTTRSTMNRTNLINPLRLIPELTPRQQNSRKPISLTQRNNKKKNIRKYAIDDEPPYTKDTISSYMRYEESPEPEIKPKPSSLSLNTGVLNPTFSFNQKIKLASFETQKIEICKSRPSTGPHVNRRFVKGKQKSCANISDYYFDPPVVEISEMETQSFRPFYARVRPALEKLKVNHSRVLSQY